HVRTGGTYALREPSESSTSKFVGGNDALTVEVGRGVLHFFYLQRERFDLLLPIVLGTEVRKRRFESAVFPSARDPRGKVNHAKRPQRLDELHRRHVESSDLFVGLEQDIPSLFPVVVVSAGEHPDVLNGRRVEHVVEIDEVRIVSIPQNISGVAIAVEQNVLDILETRSNGVANLRYDRFEATCEFHRHEVSVF